MRLTEFSARTRRWTRSRKKRPKLLIDLLLICRRCVILRSGNNQGSICSRWICRKNIVSLCLKLSTILLRNLWGFSRSKLRMLWVMVSMTAMCSRANFGPLWLRNWRKWVSNRETPFRIYLQIWGNLRRKNSRTNTWNRLRNMRVRSWEITSNWSV